MRNLTAFIIVVIILLIIHSVREVGVAAPLLLMWMMIFCSPIIIMGSIVYMVSKSD